MLLEPRLGCHPVLTGVSQFRLLNKRDSMTLRQTRGSQKPRGTSASDQNVYLNHGIIGYTAGLSVRIISRYPTLVTPRVNERRFDV
jgi:hypothetical protein